MKNIEATSLLKKEGANDVKFNDVVNGKYLFVYTSPEFIMSTLVSSLRTDVNLTRRQALIVIDEAHCVEEWAKFRPHFSELKKLRSILKTVFMVLTATCSDEDERVMDELLGFNKLDSTKVFRGTADRPEILFAMLPKTKFDKDLLPILQLMSEYNSPEPGNLLHQDIFPCIIYVPTITEATEIGYFLKQSLLQIEIRNVRIPDHQGIQDHIYLTKRVVAFSGRSSEQHKKTVIQMLSSDPRRFDIIVATSAFGMGVDIPCIRTVINYGTPKTMNLFYQQSGRAGRDRNAALCLTFVEKKHAEGFNSDQCTTPDMTMQSFVSESWALSYFDDNALPRYFDDKIRIARLKLKLPIGEDAVHHIEVEGSEISEGSVSNVGFRCLRKKLLNHFDGIHDRPQPSSDNIPGDNLDNISCCSECIAQIALRTSESRIDNEQIPGPIDGAQMLLNRIMSTDMKSMFQLVLESVDSMPTNLLLYLEILGRLRQIREISERKSLHSLFINKINQAHEKRRRQIRKEEEKVARAKKLEEIQKQKEIDFSPECQ
jgi:hypothetical protein